MLLKVKNIWKPGFVIINTLIMLSSCTTGGSGDADNSSSADSLQVNNQLEETVLTKDDTLKMVIKEVLDSIFVSAGTANYKNAASRILYRGNDEARIYRDTFKPDSEEELKALKETLYVINLWVKKAETYKLGEVSYLQDQFGKWLVQEVVFISGNEIHSKYFIFQMNADKYLLGNIQSRKPQS